MPMLDVQGNEQKMFLRKCANSEHNIYSKGRNGKSIKNFLHSFYYFYTLVTKALCTKYVECKKTLKCLKETPTHCTSSLYGSPSQSHTHLYIWEKPPEHRGNKQQRGLMVTDMKEIETGQRAKQLKWPPNDAEVQGLLPQGPGSAGLLFSHSACRDDSLSTGSRLSFFITLLLRNKRPNQTECMSHPPWTLLKGQARASWLSDWGDAVTIYSLCTAGNFCICSQASCSQQKSSVWMRAASATLSSW